MNGTLPKNVSGTLFDAGNGEKRVDLVGPSQYGQPYFAADSRTVLIKAIKTDDNITEFSSVAFAPELQNVIATTAKTIVRWNYNSDAILSKIELPEASSIIAAGVHRLAGRLMGRFVR